MSPPSGTSLHLPPHPTPLGCHRTRVDEINFLNYFKAVLFLFVFFFFNNMGSEYCIINQNRNSLIQGQL